MSGMFPRASTFIVYLMLGVTPEEVREMPPRALKPPGEEKAPEGAWGWYRFTAIYPHDPPERWMAWSYVHGPNGRVAVDRAKVALINGQPHTLGQMRKVTALQEVTC